MNIFEKIYTHAHWILRLALASVFVYHGIFMLKYVPNSLQNLGIIPFEAITIGLIQVVAPILILLGAVFTVWLARAGCAMLIGLLIYFIIQIHWGQWSFVASKTHPAGGMEFPVVLMAICIYLFFWNKESSEEVIE